MRLFPKSANTKELRHLSQPIVALVEMPTRTA
jgi:hypothetical protein